MILIVQSLWNEAITSQLAEGARAHLKAQKMNFKCLQVPGALEIALAIQSEAKRSKKIKGAIACGTVVKGDTYHFEIVAHESARALTDLSLKLDLPIANAILTTFDIDQALERAGGKVGNKGSEAAEAVIRMIHLLNPPKRRR